MYESFETKWINFYVSQTLVLFVRTFAYGQIVSSPIEYESTIDSSRCRTEQLSDFMYRRRLLGWHHLVARKPPRELQRRWRAERRERRRSADVKQGRQRIWIEPKPSNRLLLNGQVLNRLADFVSYIIIVGVVVRNVPSFCHACRSLLELTW